MKKIPEILLRGDFVKELANELKADKEKAKVSGLPTRPVTAMRNFCLECVGGGGRKEASKLVIN